MFSGRTELRRSLAARRLGGPILLKDLLPALLDELHEVYAARGGLDHFDLGLARDEHELGDASAAFSTAA